MKRPPKIFLIATFFVIIICAPILLNKYYDYLLQPPSKNQTQEIFIVKQGQTVSEIAINLKKVNLIKSPLAFRLLVTQIGIAKNIQAGDFRLSHDMSAKAIAAELTHGAIDVWITLPEGLRKEEQAAKFEEKLKFGAQDKYQFNKKEYIKIAEEGYMFPDTYLIPKDATAQDIAKKMRFTFDSKVQDELAKNKTFLSTDEIIKLASLIERESKTEEERPIIAGILINRLNARIALQVDATVQYAKGYDSSRGSWWPQITTDDYQSVKSPFNTYLNIDLPPTPICSPGLASIKAALNPKDTDFLFYLHDLQGRVHYSKTIQEHNENIKKYL